MNELSPAEKKTLRTVVLHFGEEPFTAEAIEAALPGEVTGYEAELGIEKLRKRGVAVTRKKAWGERFHTLAPGMFAVWQKAFLAGDVQVCDVTGLEAESFYEPRKGFPALLFSLLAFAEFEGLALTQKGTFHKKDMARLQGLLDVTDDDVAGMDMAYIHQDKIGKPLAIVYDAALRLGLLRSGLGRAEVVREQAETWLSLTQTEMNERLLDLWMDVYTPREAWLQHIAVFLRALSGNRWISVDRLLRLLRESGVPIKAGPKEALSACLSYWIRPMAAFGWLQTGKNAGETVVKRTVTAGETDERQGWYVQPNFEVFVPPQVPYKAKWALAACAEYRGGDAVDCYVITRQSWERSLAAGTRGAEMIARLKAHAAYGVPEHVEAALREWSEQYGAVTIEEVTLLRCRNAKDADFLRSDESAAPFLLEEVGALDFIVPKEQVKLLTEVLKRRGFSPRLIGERPAAQTAAAPDAAGSRGIVYAKRSPELFPIDIDPPGIERLHERLGQVPKTWLRSFRKYHVSTIKQLVETAIDVRTSVRLKVGDQEVNMVPMRVEPSGSDWMFRGFVNGRETQVPSNRCGEAQLIIPELD